MAALPVFASSVRKIPGKMDPRAAGFLSCRACTYSMRRRFWPLRPLCCLDRFGREAGSVLKVGRSDFFTTS